EGDELDADAAAIPCEGVRDAEHAHSRGLAELLAAQALPVRPPVPIVQQNVQPVTDPPTWKVQSGSTAAVVRNVDESLDVKGGAGSNPHNTYVAAAISRAFGEVFVVRVKAPTVPMTREGAAVMGTGDLRYWSFCQNSASTRYVACAIDEDFALDVVDDEPWLTLVVSGPGDRPANAENWIPFGPETEGILLWRHMLPNDAFFPRSAQAAAESVAPLETSMGEYFPRGFYCSKAGFEADRCGLD
ncbi:MAG: hypothetical protein ACREQY_05800, partial [Candidatus Binatia bacterium]